MEANTPVVLIRASTILYGIPMKTVLNVIIDSDIRKSWDKVVHNFEEIIIDEESELSYIYFLVKTPFGTSDRDFVNM